MLRRNEMVAEVKKILLRAPDTPVTTRERHEKWAYSLAKEIVERIEQLKSADISRP
jgi:hypothetical protein